MKRISRRQFAKLAGSAAAVAIPVGAGFSLPDAGRPEGPPLQTPSTQQALNAPPPPPEPRVKLTPDQETRVKQAIERRDRQLAGFRARVLPYELEPAFVFQVKKRSEVRK